MVYGSSGDGNRGVRDSGDWLLKSADHMLDLLFDSYSNSDVLPSICTSRLFFCLTLYFLLTT